MNTKIIAFGLLAAASTIAANAGSETFGPDSIPSTGTDWSQTITFPKFDTSLGTLTEVDFSLSGTLTGTAKAENTGNGSITPTLDLSASITLVDSLSTILAQTTPLVANSVPLATFDGTIDFAGTSGKTFSGLSQAYSTNSIVTSGSDLALFKGTGNISLTFSASGTSQVLNGGGNIISQFITVADGSAQITYKYSTPVPEASTWAAIGFVGFAGGFTYWRRRKAQAPAQA